MPKKTKIYSVLFDKIFAKNIKNFSLAWLYMFIAIGLPSIIRHTTSNSHSKEFTDTLMLFSIIVGLAWLILSIILMPILNILTRYTFIKRYPNEKVKFIFNATTGSAGCAVLLLQFVSGGLIGYYILPFFIVKGLTNIEMVTLNNLPIFILLWLLFVTVTYSLQCAVLVLTNKRLVPGGNLFLDLKKDILLADIKNIERTKNSIRIEYGDKEFQTIQLNPNSIDKLYEKLNMAIRKEGVNNE